MHITEKERDRIERCSIFFKPSQNIYLYIYSMLYIVKQTFVRRTKLIKIFRFWWKFKVHYRVLKDLRQFYIPRMMNPIHILTYNFFSTHFNNTLPSASRSTKQAVCSHTISQFKMCIYRGADKSLARQGRKQTTATENFEFHISYL